MKIKTFFIALASALMVVAGVSFAAYLKGLQNGRKEAENAAPVIITDTLRIVDTVKIDRPVYINRETVRTELVAVRDTVTLRDTLFIQLPRESVTYAGEDYRAVVSGFRPALDSIEVYRRTEVVTQTVVEKTPAKGWGIGPVAGACAVTAAIAVAATSAAMKEK